MPTPVNGYCLLADLKSADVLKTAATANDDQFLCDIITAVSREIDNTLSRYFYQASTTSETRYFTAVNSTRVNVGDMVSISALATDTTTGSRTYPYSWATTDYDMWPYDASNSSEPYMFIDVTPTGNYTFPLKIAKGVKVTGIWGWPAIPAPIAKACLLQSGIVFDRYKARLGVTSMSALGQITVKAPTLDPLVMNMIGTYRRPAI